MSIDILFRPLQLGALSLPNRIVMPALTRMRAGPGSVPTALNAEYYGQRASAGLNITEATAISVQGHGYPNMPGIHTAEQIAGWHLVTDSVHAKGGRIVLQIVHHGRWSHSSYNPDGSLPVAPSAIAPPGKAYTAISQQVAYETPRALKADELPGIVADFRRAARSARAAGFDAVEIHGANGFLLDQFLQDGSNHRTDAYGATMRTAHDCFSRWWTASSMTSARIVLPSGSRRMAIWEVSATAIPYLISATSSVNSANAAWLICT